MQKLSMDQLERPDVETFKKQSKIPVILVLDNVRSMHNVGSAFRTSDAFAVEKIILGGITGTPPHREIEKTALGATSSVDWEHAPDLVSKLQKLKAEGYQILAIEQAEGSVMLHQFKPSSDQKYAFVFGNEVHGVDEEIMKISDGCLEIPQFGTKHSFNISVTIGIVLWDFVVKNRFN
ncbi:RNA methyltransferase [Sphingobacterium spiritivorum]|uniref:RNA methyltransferase n=1 Tax=Sphingobacterium spiritivorum TaxID=258 RepID=UPI003DA3256F